MPEDGIKVGALLTYEPVDGAPFVYGVVIECVERDSEPFAKVIWMDDLEFSFESVEYLRDPFVDYISVIYEAR